MQIRFNKILLAGFLILQGCVRIPPCDLAQKSEAVSCEGAAAQALANGAVQLGDWPDREWWNQFNDPTLTCLIEQAINTSPTLAQAEENLRKAYQVAKQTRSALFPEIYLDGDSNWQHLARDGFFRAFAPVVPAMVNDIHLGFSYSYEFDFWGKNRDLFRAALDQASAMAAERMQAELILTTSIAYTYVQTQFLMHKKQLLEQIEANDEAIQSIRSLREQHALDSAITYLQSESGTLDAKAPIIEISEEIQVQIHKIKALAGMGQDADLPLYPQPLCQPLAEIPENISLNLLGRRPDLLAQKWRVEAAARQIGAAKTDFYPNVNISGLLGLESIFWSTLFQKKNYSGNMDPAISLPIFTAGRIKAHLKEKVAEFNAAVFDYNDLILKAAQEIADTLTSIHRLKQEIAVRQQSLAVAEKQAGLTAKRVENALDDRIALLRRENEVLNAEITLVELEYGKILASIELIRGLGGGYCD